METSSMSTKSSDLVLSVWPNCKHLSTIDPTCLATLLWLRAQGVSCSIVNANRQISMVTGTYPSLHDRLTDRIYVGFDSIYEHTRTSNPSADELALLAAFQRRFVPAFMHSQWLDDTNKTSLRTLFHYSIGLPTSLVYIQRKLSLAHTWFNLASVKFPFQNEILQQNRIYAEAEQCLTMLESELNKANHPFIGGEKFSLIDTWVSAYLLVLVHYASDKSRLKSLFLQHARLVDYIKRIDEEQSLLDKQHEERSLSPIVPSSTDSVDLISVLHVISQVISFSVFFLMLTKIGANSYK